MNKTATNLVVLLGIVAVMFGGYFFFTQDSQMFLDSATSDLQLERLFSSSQVFIERSQILSKIDMDTSIFESVVFNSLKSFSPPPNEFLIGRLNPFEATGETKPLNAVTNQ